MALMPDDAKWDMSGDEPRWEQPHESLVKDAVHSWGGWPTDMQIHMGHEQAGAPQPGSGTGKRMRAQAAALLTELQNGKVNDKPLYRGSHEEPHGVQSWSESRKVASGWAKKKEGGRVHTAAPGTLKGIRRADYVGDSGINEKEWIGTFHDRRGE